MRQGALRFGMVLCIAGCWMLAACGGGGEPASGGNAQAEAAETDSGGDSVDACSLVTQADATALFGQEASPQEGTPSFSGMMLGDCLWTWDTETSNQLLQLHVWKDRQLTPPSDAEAIDLGDEGSVRVNRVAGVDIEWRQNGMVLSLAYSTIGPDAPKAPDKAEEVKALARTVSERL